MQKINKYADVLKENIQKYPKLSYIESSVLEYINGELVSNFIFTEIKNKGTAQSLKYKLNNEVRDFIIKDTKTKEDYLEYLKRYSDFDVFGHLDNTTSKLHNIKCVEEKLGRELTCYECKRCDTDIKRTIFSIPEPLEKDKQIDGYTHIFDGYYYLRNSNPKNEDNISYKYRIYNEMRKPDESFSVFSKKILKQDQH